MSASPPITLDVAATLSKLAQFQRDAVDHAFHRLYEVPDSTHRFLIADEVGLGKTHIAKGILARAIEHLSTLDIERIDIVYVCSNQQIAEQNLRRLNPTGEPIARSAKRITLLPLELDALADKRLNFAAFTPGTSFELQGGLGKSEERLLLHALLDAHWHVEGTGPFNVCQGFVQKTERFRERARDFRKDHPISTTIERAFHDRLEQEVARQKSAGDRNLETEWRELCDRFRVARPDWPEEERRSRNHFISSLRTLLARTCIESLQPELVILDEFQRFKHLLKEDNEAAELAHALFNYADEKTNVRVLLLSATPYKMYTLAEESADDDHYADFLQTVKFLDPDPIRRATFESALAEWRGEIFRLGDGCGDRLRELKTRIEGHLRRVMSRTERISAGPQAAEMLVEVRSPSMTLEADDVEAFSALAEIARELEAPGVLDLWKSAPFPLNFMDDYALKIELHRRAERADQGALPELVNRANRFLLDWRQVKQYAPLSSSNAQMRTLVADLEQAEAFRLLWMPPTLPYWVLEGAFETARAAGFTKRLIFSNWAVVPKAIATLVSYEVERRAFHAVEEHPQNTADARKQRKALLRFAKADERLTGMPILALMYPSAALAKLGDPLSVPRSPSSPPSLEQVLTAIEDRIRPHLRSLCSAAATTGDEDESWYWAAPLLLDRLLYPKSTQKFWKNSHLDQVWTGDQAEDQDDTDGVGPEGTGHARRFSEHLDYARCFINGETPRGRPPDGLDRVCALLALAGPANTVLRALAQHSTGTAANEHIGLRNAAARVAWGFRAYLNRPESMALVQASSHGQPYWRQVLHVAAAGCLSSVVDEWTALLWETEGFTGQVAETVAARLADAMTAALSLRTATHDVEEILVRGGRVTTKSLSMRAHFALRFGSEKTEDQKQVQRESQVQRAFNSPFWPMVLATTSIGQEGLDFHPYCHAVVHWNLPANPVDLEQREGRVNRFNNHAVRKNVAARHGSDALQACSPGAPIAAALQRARDAATGSGLIPNWVYPIENGARIERHVPALPLSKDAVRISDLRRSLAVYRLVFGQPRQEDLLAWLLAHVPESALREAMESLRINLAPRK